ncbi:iron ABC transporter permease [Thiotrichales bacterium 19S3-7]|nr:iron ABC transporter permease [Thiotrichales bacterium 19S3-7]MCF6802837.1 iron ABC transporter permease [Thiotrichales bacterium 19S3-11]
MNQLALNLLFKKANSTSRFYQFRKKQLIILSLLMVILLISFCLALACGSIHISFFEMLNNLFFDHSLNHMILIHLRLPRILATILIGASLAISGVLMQGILRNPLADPALLGMTSGASLMAVLFMLFITYLPFTNFLLLWGLPISAFIGSLMITWIIYRLSVRNSQPQIALLVLAGVAINALAGAFIGLLTFFANDNELRSITFWSMGSFAQVNWWVLLTALPLFIIALVFLRKIYAFLNAMSFGENQAKSFGIDINLEKKKAIIAIALLVGLSTAIAGPIGFIGLIIPHILRLVVGCNHRILLPTSALAGAILLTIADTLARTIVSPSELPIGLLTALIGSPYFIWLLINQTKKGSI